MRREKRRIYKFNKREEFFEKLPFKPVPEKSLEQSIKLKCPHSMDVIRSKDRHESIKEWRSAIMLLRWLNGDDTRQCARYVNRHHSTLHCHIQNMRNEFEICDFRIVGKMRLIIHYFDKNPQCNLITFNLQKLQE
jgi:hypothetical protein